MNQPIDFICFSLFRHDDPISSTAMEISRELAKHHRVYFIEHPVTWKDAFFSKAPVVKRAKLDNTGKGYHLKSVGENFFVITPPAVLPVNFLPGGKLYNLLWGRNQHLLNHILRQVIQDYGISQYAFLNFYAPIYFRQIPDDIQPYKKVYFVLDAIDEVPYTAKHGVKAEKDQVMYSGIVCCSSKLLYDKYAAFHSGVHYLPNGANVEVFIKAAKEQFPVPDELQPYSGFRIGYLGSIDYRMDFRLLNAVASHHHDKTFFLLGPLHTTEVPDRKNIVHIPPKEQHLLPAYLQHFDCLIIPFIKNRLTAAIYPLKLNEYLATGKPVVTTNFSEDLKEFQAMIYTAENADEFNSSIDKALQENSVVKDMRITAAAQNSWENRCKTLLAFIMQ